MNLKATSSAKASDTLRLAVVGDVHLYRLLANPLLLLNKRLIGQANLWLVRRRKFRLSLLAEVWRKVLELQPEALLLTGDLTTVSLPGEFADAAKMLEPVTRKLPAWLVPGNHDRYTPCTVRSKLLERALGHVMPAAYPHLQPLGGRWHVLMLDAAFPQGLAAEGRLGPEQLRKAAKLLDSLPGDAGLVVMCHYPAFPLPPGVHAHGRHQLLDAAELREVLKPTARLPGPVLYLHGHIHLPWLNRCDLPGLSHVVDVNAGAPCHVGSTYPRGQGFWEMHLPLDLAGTVTLMHHHRSDTDGHTPHWQVNQHVCSV